MSRWSARPAGHANASASLESSPNATTVAGRSSASSDSIASRLPPAVPRPEIDDQPAPVVGEIVRRQAALGLLDRGLDGGARCQRVVGLAHVERHGRALALDEQPGRVAEEDRDAVRQSLGRFV